MKTDLFTAIVVAVIGVVAAFVVTNIFLPELETVSFKTLGTESNYSSLSEPGNEVFNYRALNPTVEVYVGQCEVYNENGECVKDVTTGDDEEEEENNEAENSEEENAEAEEGDNGASD